MSSLKDVSREMSRMEIKEEGTLEGRYYKLEQKHDTLECLFCCFCEGANEYTVCESDPNFNVSSKKGSIKEDSECLARVFCVCNRPFEAKLKIFGEEIAVAERPCKCWLEFFPCAQNELVVSNSTERVLGVLRVPCSCLCSGSYYTCSDAQIEILHPTTAEVLYTIEGSYCQKSIFCPCFRCCYCPTVDYTIFDNLKLKVGKISQIYNGCFYEIFSRTDTFGIEFPAKAEKEHKILLIYAVMYLDYLRYETPYCCLGIR